MMELMEPYYFKGHCLFIDNFYTSVKLLVDLLDKGTYCTGTARPNRKYFPVEILPAARGGIWKFSLCCGHTFARGSSETFVQGDKPNTRSVVGKTGSVIQVDKLTTRSDKQKTRSAVQLTGSTVQQSGDVVQENRSVAQESGCVLQESGSVAQESGSVAVES